SRWLIATAGWRRRHGEEGGEDGPDSEVFDELVEGVGAYIMGRKMFGGGAGPWDEEWKGWWGDEPPYHTRFSCSLTSRANHCRYWAAPRSLSSRMGSRRRCARP